MPRFLPQIDTDLASKSEFSITNSKYKTAIVFGASSGLGFEIANCLGQKGFAVLLIGRDRQRLEKAAKKVETSGSPAVSELSIDISSVSRDELKKRVNEMVAGMHSISPDQTQVDTVINAIGVSDRGSLLELNDDEYHESFQQNVITTIHGVYATRDSLARANGCVVNIGSLASLFAPAGVGCYAMSKFALAGVTQQLRMELRVDGIHFLLVCPGPISSDRQGPRYIEKIEQRELSGDATRPGAGAKISLLNPQQLAKDVVRAIEKRRILLIRPRKAALLYAIQSCWPKLGDWLLRKFSGRS